MHVLETVLIVLEVIASLGMIVLVLLQSGKEAGLSGALSGSTNSYLSKNKQSSRDHLYATCTKWVAIVWVLLTLSLSFF